MKLSELEALASGKENAKAWMELRWLQQHGWYKYITQLEADLECHEAKIKHYPDSYLGKIFFQGVDQGRKQLEAENERLAQIVADRTPFIYATYAADDLVEALHPGIIFEEARFALAEYVRKRKQCPDKVGGALKAGDIGE